jgi:hypothetical protein
VGLWVVVTAISFVGAILLIANLAALARDLITRLVNRRPIDDNETVRAFLVFCGIIYLMPLLPGSLFDRYLIPAIPFFAVGIIGVSEIISGSSFVNPKSLQLAAITLVTAFSLFAICATRDYLTWNRVRWAALQDLAQMDHVNVQDIDGGFEFNGLYLYDPDVDVYQAMKDDTLSWWWVHRDTYQIGFGVVPGYTVIKEYSYRTWLPWKLQNIFVLRKE